MVEDQNGGWLPRGRPGLVAEVGLSNDTPGTEEMKEEEEGTIKWR